MALVKLMRPSSRTPAARDNALLLSGRMRVRVIKKHQEQMAAIE